MKAMLTDILVFLAVWVVAQRAFRGYEAHVSLQKRATKLLVMTATLLVVHWFFGRWGFYGVLAVLTLGIGLLHGYWFHYKHGIHWRKAEPREKYLQLIGRDANPESRSS